MWETWKRWISEIVADFWSIARVGITSTLGLISVVGLPRYFVFRIDLHDPHPAPWLRVKLSCAIGDVLYPHPQWDQIARMWEACYPLQGLKPSTERTFHALAGTIPAMAHVLCAHRPPSLRGRELGAVLASPDRHPMRLTAIWRRWQSAPALIFRAPPSLVFAVLGRARLAGELGPEQESRLLEDLLTHWALRSTLDTSQLCAAHIAQRRRAATSVRPQLAIA